MMKLSIAAIVLVALTSGAAADSGHPWPNGKYKTAALEREISVERMRVHVLYAQRLYANDVRCKKVIEGEAVPRQTDSPTTEGDISTMGRNLDSQDLDFRMV